MEDLEISEDDILSGTIEPHFDSLSDALQINYLIELFLEDKMKEIPNLKKAKLSNQFASVCLKGQKLEKAQELFLKALTLFEMFKKESEFEELKHHNIHFTNAYFNLASSYAAEKNYSKAIEYFLLIIRYSPFNRIKSQETQEKFVENNFAGLDNADEMLKKCHFNAFEALILAYSNISVMYMFMNKLELAKLAATRALELQPNKTDAHVNYGNILRQVTSKIFH
jgi:tetratricopeptide (TPR) repeat protein